jgi:hypothetical protein
LQEEASGYPPLLLPKEVVVNREGQGPGDTGSRTLRKRNASKTPLLVSKIAKTISKPQFGRRLEDEFRRNLVTAAQK